MDRQRADMRSRANSKPEKANLKFEGVVLRI